MHTLEQFLQGKYNNPLVCEDRIVVSGKLAAVIDGATAKGTKLWNGAKSGKFASIILGDYIENNSDRLITCSAKECFARLTEVLNTRTRELPGTDRLDIKDYPRASVIIYNDAAKEVWRYGDCQCMIGGKLYSFEKAVDRLNHDLRSYILELAILQGASLAELQENDIGREAIRYNLETQFYFENRQMPFGYPVLNGLTYDPDMAVVYPVLSGETVILASDGYPRLKPTLAESEEQLRILLDTDPLCFRENPGTKGLMPGMTSFDDRAYWRGIAS